MKFSDLNLTEELLSGLRDLRFDEPTPVQEKAIPHVLAGKDIIATAQTGTGKTGAFVIPVIQRIMQGDRNGIKAVILTPTRELAQQIDEQIFALGYHTGITSATVIGGSDFSSQAKALKAGVDIVVATPGRFIDQNKIVNIDFSTVDYLVLDEADRMLDMGFLPDMKKIIGWIPPKRQTLLFSATMPKEIENLASSIMNHPVQVEIARSKPSQSVEQRVYFLKSNQKIPLIRQIFDEIKWDSCIIFTSTKKGTDELQRLLKKKGIKAGSIHGDRSQDERNRALNAFKNGEIPVIVATNVIARGIDIKDVSMIVNYDAPGSADDYIHRIGRTGRYDKSGIAVTFVTKRDRKSFSEIEKIKDNRLKKITLPDSFDESSRFSWDGPIEAGRREKQEADGRGSKSGEGREDSRASRKTTPDKSSAGEKGRVKRTQSSSKQSPDEDSRRKSQKKSTPDNRSGGREKGTVQERVKSGGRTAGEAQATESSLRKSAASGQPESSRELIAELPIPPKIEKATERNRYSRKPAKGFWGIVKSVIPRFRPD